MHDLKWIRENPALFETALKRRPAYSDFKVDALLELDKASRGGKTELQHLQARRNEVAKLIGEAMRTDKAKAEVLKQEATEIKAKIAQLESGEEEGGELTGLLATLPNILAEDVPNGADESANVEVRRNGSAPKIESPRDHVAIGEALGMMDFETAAKISGARFVILTGALARLERALAQFMLDLHTTQFGYTEVNPPYLVRDNALFGTGQLPKFEEDLFKVIRNLPNEEELQGVLSLMSEHHNLEEKNEEVKQGALGTIRKYMTPDLWLIPTAEVSLTNIVADAIVAPESLPRRYTAHTPCFRSEAGSAGRDTRGMIRQHQFSKVELVSITKPEDSNAEHERMLGCAEEVLKRLGLHYRVMLLCAGDTGFSARKTYDIEVWLPAQNTFREISSCSNCGDFQARRMKARYRTEKGTEFLHTLNGSALAVGRTLVAILENYQQPDGSVLVPEVLRPYMGGMERIEK
jgi:seryl-tRNA synthetase